MSTATGGGAWRSAAACAGLGPALFYDPRARSIEVAKRICERCPVEDCAELARTVGEQLGIWGGQTEAERAVRAGSGPALPGPASVISDGELLRVLRTADPRMRAVDVIQGRLDVSTASAYRYLGRALRLGAVEQRGRNLFPVHPTRRAPTAWPNPMVRGSVVPWPACGVVPCGPPRRGCQARSLRFGAASLRSVDRPRRAGGPKTPVRRTRRQPRPEGITLMQANELFTKITDQIIADIEAGAGTWKMPWHCLAETAVLSWCSRLPAR